MRDLIIEEMEPSHKTPKLNDWYVKPIEMITNNWAFIFEDNGIEVIFVRDDGEVFDKMRFESKEIAVKGLIENGFIKFSSDEEVKKDKQSGDEILFESLGRLYEQGKITIHDDELLNESILGLARTGVILVNSTKGLNQVKKFKTLAKSLDRHATNIRNAKTPEDTQRPLSDAIKTIGDLFEINADVLRRLIFISASGGLFIDRTYKYLQKMEKKRR